MYESANESQKQGCLQEMSHYSTSIASQNLRSVQSSWQPLHLDSLTVLKGLHSYPRWGVRQGLPASPRNQKAREISNETGRKERHDIPDYN